MKRKLAAAAHLLATILLCGLLTSIRSEAAARIYTLDEILAYASTYRLTRLRMALSGGGPGGVALADNVTAVLFNSAAGLLGREQDLKTKRRAARAVGNNKKEDTKEGTKEDTKEGKKEDSEDGEQDPRLAAVLLAKVSLSRV